MAVRWRRSSLALELVRGTRSYTGQDSSAEYISTPHELPDAAAQVGVRNEAEEEEARLQDELRAREAVRACVRACVCVCVCVRAYVRACMRVRACASVVDTLMLTRA